MSKSLIHRILPAIGVAALLSVAVAAGAVAQQLLASATQPQLAEAANAEIDIKDFAFGPGTLTVARGTKVTWVNKDEEPHNIVSLDVQPHKFQSKALGDQDSFSVTLDEAGTYRYICAVHPFMQGTIVVQ